MCISTLRWSIHVLQLSMLCTHALLSIFLNQTFALHMYACRFLCNSFELWAYMPRYVCILYTQKKHNGKNWLWSSSIGWLTCVTHIYVLVFRLAYATPSIRMYLYMTIVFESLWCYYVIIDLPSCVLSITWPYLCICTYMCISSYAHALRLLENLCTYLNMLACITLTL